MNKHINKDNLINNMIKYISILFLLLLSVSSINAVSFTSDNTVQGQYENSNLAYVQSNFFSGITNLNQTFNNISWLSDFKVEVNSLNSDLFISYPNSQNLDILKIHITTFPKNNPSVRTTYLINFTSGVGQYYFKLSPTYKDENFRIEFDAPDTFNNEIIISITKNQFIAESTNITDTFIGAMKDLININIGFWKILYYLFIFGVIISTIGLLIGFGFKFYMWAEQLSDKKKQLFTGHKGKENNNKSRED